MVEQRSKLPITRRLRIIGRLTLSFILQEARSKNAIFWMVAFPVFIFVFFGFVFSQTNFETKDMTIGMDRALVSQGNESKLLDRVLKQNESLDVEFFDPPKGIQMLAEGEIQAYILQLPEKDNYTIYITERNLPFVSMLSGMLDRSNLETVKPFFRGRMPFEYEVQVVSHKGKRLSYIYFLFAGVMAIALMMNGLFAIPQTIINYRKLGFLKRFAFSPLGKFEFTCSLMVQRICLGALQIALLSVSAILIFGIKLTTAPFAFLLTFLAGTAAFSVLGFFLAGVIQSVEAAVAIAQILNMVLMFTGGVFFPLEIIPDYFQFIVRINPVYYLARAVYATAVLGEGIDAIGDDLLILAGVFAVFFLLTIITFRYQKRV